MRKFILVFTLILFVLIVGTVVLAEDEGPSLCTDGTWDCADPDDPAREAWNWACGWYWGHFIDGQISEVPDWCKVDVEELNLCAIPRWVRVIYYSPPTNWDIHNADTQDFINTVTEDPGLPLCDWVD